MEEPDPAGGGRDPGALNTDSSAGRLAQAVLAGLEPIPFSGIALGELPARLLVATLETVSAQPGLLTGDPRVQELVKAAARGLAQDVGARVAALRASGDSDSWREERIAEWGDLAFRSILGTGGGWRSRKPGRCSVSSRRVSSPSPPPLSVP